jgi:UDP-glucose 4-epimerase
MHYSKKVLVTGGAGFIGSHTVVELHNAGYEPVILDNFCNSVKEVPARIARIIGREVPVLNLDCLDEPALEKAILEHGPWHSVIHFAAYKAVGESVELPLKYYENNIGSLVALLKAMQKAGMPGLVFSSSCTVYGEPDSLPVTEDSPIQPANSPYGYTKQVCEQLVRDCVRADLGLKAVTLRYFNPIGAHPSGLIGELPIGRPNNLVPYITQTAAGKMDKLTVFGKDYGTADGTAVRDYIHVVDLARAHVMALRLIEQSQTKSVNHVANVGTGQGSSVLEVIQAFESATGLKLPYEFGPRRAGDIEAIWADSKAEGQLPGWKAELSLETALADAWRWQQSLKSLD